MSKNKIYKDKSDPKLTKRLLTSKPFCDCMRCTCKDCPDILKMLSITVTDTTCHFDSKVVREDDKSSELGESTKPKNLLDVINQNRSCNCEVVARGVRDHVHKNIGMSERRQEITDLIKICDERCKERAEKSEHEENEENGNETSTKESTEKKTTEKPPCIICESIHKDKAGQSETKQ